VLLFALALLLHHLVGLLLLLLLLPHLHHLRRLLRRLVALLLDYHLPVFLELLLDRSLAPVGVFWRSELLLLLRVRGDDLDVPLVVLAPALEQLLLGRVGRELNSYLLGVYLRSQSQLLHLLL
jgi:hypothetical protein